MGAGQSVPRLENKQEKSSFLPNIIKTRSSALTRKNNIPKSLLANPTVKKVRKIFPTMGALCDSEGFYQHIGECWSDTIQMIFLFSDGFKEVIQRKLLMEPIDDIFVENLINTFRKREKGPYSTDFDFSDESDRRKRQLKEYLIVVRNRLARHYLAEYERRSGHENEYKKLTNVGCQLDERKAAYDELIKISKKYRAKGHEGILAAIRAKPTLLKKEKSITEKKYRESEQNNAENLRGGTIYDISFITDIYNAAFFENKLKIHHIDLFYEKKRNDAIIKEKNYINLANAIYLMAAKHAMCFYICGNQEFFYEDNTGPIPFPWKHFLATYYNLMIDDMWIKKFYKPEIYMIGLLFQSIGGFVQINYYYPLMVFWKRDEQRGQESGIIFTEINNKVYRLKFLVSDLKTKDELNFEIINEGENNKVVILTIKTNDMKGPSKELSKAFAIYLESSKEGEKENVSFQYSPFLRGSNWKITDLIESKNTRSLEKKIEYINFENMDLDLVMWSAIQEKNITLIKLLIEKGIFPKKVIEKYTYQISKILLNKLIRHPSDEEYNEIKKLADELKINLIKRIILNKDIDGLMLLLNKGEDPNQLWDNNQNLLMYAIKNFDVYLLTVLLASGANYHTTSTGQNLLNYISDIENPIIEQIEKLKRDIDILHGEIPIIKKLIEDDIKKRDVNKMSTVFPYLSTNEGIETLQDKYKEKANMLFKKKKLLANLTTKKYKIDEMKEIIDRKKMLNREEKEKINSYGGHHKKTRKRHMSKQRKTHRRRH